MRQRSGAEGIDSSDCDVRLFHRHSDDRGVERHGISRSMQGSPVVPPAITSGQRDYSGAEITNEGRFIGKHYRVGDLVKRGR